jgi:hypothetical protein
MKAIEKPEVLVSLAKNKLPNARLFRRKECCHSYVETNLQSCPFVLEKGAIMELDEGVFAENKRWSSLRFVSVKNNGTIKLENWKYSESIYGTQDNRP